MKKEMKGVLIGGIVGLILGFILILIFDTTGFSLLLLIIVGTISGIIFSLRDKIKLMTGWIGFLIPWLYYGYLNISCMGSQCGHLGMGIPIILVYSIITSIIGIIIGYTISIFKKNAP